MRSLCLRVVLLSSPRLPALHSPSLLPPRMPQPSTSAPSSLALTAAQCSPESRGMCRSRGCSPHHSRSGSPADILGRRFLWHRALGTPALGSQGGTRRPQSGGHSCLHSGMCRGSGSWAPKTGCCTLEERETGQSRRLLRALIQPASRSISCPLRRARQVPGPLASIKCSE